VEKQKVLAAFKLALKKFPAALLLGVLPLHALKIASHGFRK
jgi:hypothetical protein